MSSAHRTQIRQRLDREDRDDLAAQLDEQLGIQPSEHSASTRPLVYTSRERGPKIVSSASIETGAEAAAPEQKERLEPPPKSKVNAASQESSAEVSNGDTQERSSLLKEKSSLVGGVLGSIKENSDGQYDTMPQIEPTPQGFPEAYHRSQKPMSRFKAAKLAGKLNKEDLSTSTTTQTYNKNLLPTSGILKDQNDLAHQLNNPNTLTSILNKKLSENSGKMDDELLCEIPSPLQSESGDYSESENRAESESGKRTRFNSTPEVFTYEPEERTPRRPIAYLPPPQSLMPDFDKSKLSQNPPWDSDITNNIPEGDPEYIRRRYFPNEPSPSSLDLSSDPLAWTRPELDHQTLQPDSSINPTAHFDINGKFVESKVPKHNSYSESDDGHNHDHANSHHHAGDNLFTIPSLLTLCNSSVMGQRSSAFLILEKVLRSNLLPMNSSSIEMNDNKENGLLEHITTTNLEHILFQACQAVDDRSVSVAGTALSVLGTILCPWSERLNDSKSSDVEKEKVMRRYCFQKCVSMRPNLLSRLKNHLQNGTLPRSSLLIACNITYSLIEIGPSESPSESQIDPIQAVLDEHSFLESIVTRFIAVQWPPLAKKYNNITNQSRGGLKGNASTAEWDEGFPATIAVKILGELIRLSREAAMEILNRELLDPLGRYIAIPPWELEDETPNGQNKKEEAKEDPSTAALIHLQYGMIIHIFDTLRKLAKYQLATEICISWAPLFSDIHHHLCKLAREVNNGDTKTLVKYWNALLLELAPDSSIHSPIPFSPIEI